jgi:hypothetical protein
VQTSDDQLYKAFRLCINKDHCDRLLVESKWPAYVTISEWFFKSAYKTNLQCDNIIMSAISKDNVKVSVVTGDGNEASESNNVFMHASTDADATVIMRDHSQSPSGESCASNHHNGDS